MESKLAPYRDVKRIILTPEIYDRISDDNCPKRKDFKLPKTGYLAIGGYINKKIVSLYTVNGEEMHFMVLKPYRKHARKLLKSAIKYWPFPVYCEIASLYMEVINFAKNSGFQEVNIFPKEYLKNGKMYNIHKLILRI